MFLGFFAWYAGLARGGIARIGQVQLAQPVLTLVWAALLLGEHVSAGHGGRGADRAGLRGGHAAHAGGGRPAEGFGSLGSVTDSALLDDRELLNQGKVRDVYAEGDDRLLMVGQRPHLHVRRGPPEPDPRQGQGAHRADRVLARAGPSRSCPTT